MKLDRNTMFAAAMILSALSALGCNAAQTSAPEAAPATPIAADPQAAATTPAAASDEQTTIQAKTIVAASTQAPAPPPPRAEGRGRAPSPRHTWQDGYWRYETQRTNYVWVPGHWEDRSINAPYAPPAPRYEDHGRAPGTEFVFVKGHWRWTGRDYTWTPGHWEARRTGHDYMPPRWEKANGRWVKRDGYWRASAKVEAQKPHHADCKPPKHAKAKPSKPSVQAKVSVTVKS